jgi:SAM-dependent methyltransferase
VSSSQRSGKDIFSRLSAGYAKFRPSYPPELYRYLLGTVEETSMAWDCGTGNGQVAVELAKSFSFVSATDISRDQLKHAGIRDNIAYSLARAEDAPFPDGVFDLITVAQALHWFAFDKFFHEANRTLKPHGVLAVFGYERCTIDPSIDRVLDHLHDEIVGPYWDDERRHVETRYEHIPFPYKELTTPSFAISYDWTLDQLLGYIGTWSAVQHFIDRNASSPVDRIIGDLRRNWSGDEVKKITFPVFLRAGVKASRKPA